MSRAWRLLVVASASLLGGLSFVAHAQETPPPEAPAGNDKPAGDKPAGEAAGELAGLQGKNALADEDRGVIRNWVAKRVEVAVNQNEKDRDTIAAGAKAVADLRAEFRGTQAFKDVYGAILIEVISPVYKGAQRTASAQLVSVLGSLNEPAAAKPLIEALSDERPAVRAAAAGGLRTLRQKLAGAGANAVNEAVDALRDAGRKESSQVGLRAIYAAMNYAEGVTAPDAKRVATALLELLEARSEQYAAKNVKAEGADVVGLTLAGAMKGSLSDGERDRLLLVAARMFAYATQQYVGTLHEVQDKHSSEYQVERRNQTELLIAEAEKQIREILKPATPEPNVTKAMHEAEKQGKEGERIFNMRQEFAKWATALQARTNQKFELEEGEGK